MSLSPWEHLSTERLVRFKVFDVLRCQRRSPRTGAEIGMFTIQTLDWVHVVALDDEGRLILVRQYRHGPCTFSIELPGGAISKGEDPARAAERELLEETGYAAGRLRPLGSVNPNPAIFGNRCFTYLASGCRRVAEPELDRGEDLEVIVADRALVDAWIRDGSIDHALVLAGLCLHDLGPQA